jgi:phosphatidylserine decarboxylase
MTWFYQKTKAVTLQKGEEMGRFNMGSTIIVLFGKDCVQWNADVQAEKPVKLGEKIGNWG